MAPKLMMVMRPVAGGMWQHLLTLLDGLGDRYDLIVCCQDDPEQLELLASRSIPTRVVPMPSHIRPIADARAARVLRRAIKQERPALVHSHGFHAGLLTSLVVPFAGRPAHVCTLHGMAVWPGAGALRKAAYDPLQRLLVALTARIIVITQAVKDALPGGARAGNIVVISNGIDPARARPTIDGAEARSRIDLDGSRRVVGTVARLSPEKGVDDFVRMAGILAEVEPDVDFVVIGGGPEEAALRALAADLGVAGRIRFVGEHFPATDFMQVFDVTVIPSLLEGQSLVAIESLFLGKPVVATMIGGLPEVVTPEVGRLVPPGEPQSLARSVAEVLGSGESARMGARGKEMVMSRFTSAEMVAQTKRVYEQLLSDRRSAK